jgi:hypothetical protein
MDHAGVRNHKLEVLSVNAFILVTVVTTEEKTFIRGVKKKDDTKQMCIYSPMTSTCYYYELTKRIGLLLGSHT